MLHTIFYWNARSQGALNSLYIPGYMGPDTGLTELHVHAHAHVEI